MPGAGSGPGSMPGSGPGVANCIEMGTSGWERQGVGSGCLLHLPELGNEQAAQPGAGGAACESDAGEGAAPGWDLADAQACEDAKCGVEPGDREAAQGGTQRSSGGNLEFRDNPEGAGSQVRAQAEGESIGFLRREAIEEEVRGDEVVAVAGGGRWREGAYVGAGGGETIRGSEACGARAETAQHGRTRVDGLGVEFGGGGQEASEEAAVAVTEDEGVTGRGEVGNEGETAALEQRAKCEVFARLVDGRDAVEAARIAESHPVCCADKGGAPSLGAGGPSFRFVKQGGISVHFLCQGRRRMSGVRSIASARMRRASGERAASDEGRR